jgi:putative two-component system response regulator
MSVGKRKILVVDDEPHNILLLKVHLERMGHEVAAAENALTALELLDRSFDLVLSDVLMPEMNGFSFVQEIRKRDETRNIPVIMVTTLSEKADRLQAVEAGANDFITKPVDKLELQVRTESMLKQKAQQDEIDAFQADLQEMVEMRTHELQKALAEVDKAHIETIHHLSAAAEYKDEDTGSHIIRMAEYCAMLAEKMAMPRSEVDLILAACPMHDVGKIGIPDSILLKPGKLDLGEWEIMMTHTTIGAKILSGGDSEYMRMGTVIALTHHEKWDGTGYPAGLSGINIPLVGRICTVADVFDALTSKRPYKEAFPVEKSLAIMQEERATRFDPDIYDLFMDNLDTVLKIKEKYQD